MGLSQEVCMFDLEAHYSEYNKFRSIIKTLPNEYYEDLNSMLATLDQLMLHIHLEQVTCKRRRKITDDYAQLLNLYEKHKENIEQQLVLAVLSA
jgi:hypothetical protein